MSIRALSFLDCSIATAYLLTKHRKLFQESALIELIGEAGRAPLIEEWGSGKALLERMRLALQVDGHLAEFGRVWLQRYKPGFVGPWQKDEGDYAEAHNRVHLCLVPAPGLMMFSGTQSANLAVGQLTLIDHRIWHCSVHMGTVAAVHLIADVVRPGA